MAIRIVPHSEELKLVVDTFNHRLFKGGQTLGFYVHARPDWLAPAPGARVWREFHVALDDQGVARGAFGLKPQDWLINGQIQTVSDWQGPVSEGSIDPKYGSLALRMMRDMLKKSPLVYSFGHGGSDEPVVRLLREMQWPMHKVPLCLQVLRPRAFLRRNKFLRTDARKRAALDFLAFSGLGSIGLRALHLGLRLRRYQALRGSFVVEPTFGDWADQTWEQNRDRYSALAVRNAAMMNQLLPQGEWPPGIRLRVHRGGRNIGWVVVIHRRMKNEPRFGDLHVGTVLDAFGAPEDAADIIGAGIDYLRQTPSELVYSFMTHPAWVAAFETSGFAVIRDRRLMVMSPAFKQALDPLEQTLRGLHLTNLDGHGPQDFR